MRAEERGEERGEERVEKRVEKRDDERAKDEPLTDEVLFSLSEEEDARFREAVQVGIDQAERGEFIDEAEMDARVERMLYS
jgi:hypothetical protein